jgi:DNA-binding Lrp family transcriptional regulator
MPKSSREQIDIDEKKVIAALEENSKESIDRIAKKCGFSRQKVWRIIKRLEKNKTIWGYSAIIDDDLKGVKRFFVLIKKTNRPIDKSKLDLIITRELKKDIAKIGVYVDCSFFTHGLYDWVLCITARDIRHVKKFVEIFNTLFKGYVQDLQILDVVFPVEKNGFTNPNVKEFKEFF